MPHNAEERKKYFALLKDEIESAWRRHDSAAQAINEALSDPGSLPPHPDGIQHIRNLAREHRSAGTALMKALKRQGEFTMGGGVPEDLKA